MRAGDLVTGIAAIFLALFIFFETRGYPPPRGTEPGPAFFPMLLAGVLIIVGCIVIYQAFTADKGKKTGIGLEAKKAIMTPGSRNVVVTLVATIVYIIVLGYLGFVPATLLFLFVLMATLGVPILKSFVFSFAATIFVFYLFSNILKVILP